MRKLAEPIAAVQSKLIVTFASLTDSGLEPPLPGQKAEMFSTPPTEGRFCLFQCTK